MAQLSFQYPRNSDERNAQAHVINMVHDVSINMHKLAEKLATFAREAEDQSATQATDKALENQRNISLMKKPYTAFDVSQVALTHTKIHRQTCLLYNVPSPSPYKRLIINSKFDTISAR